MSVKLKSDDSRIGETCASTQRIILISSNPSSLHELVGELTANCYDIMVMHHMNLELFTQLHPDVLILDQRNLSLEQEIVKQLSELNIPTLNLVDVDSAGGRGDQSNIYIEWPIPVKEINSYILKLIALGTRVTTDLAQRVSFKDLVLDYRRMTVSQGNNRIELTKTEFDLLKVLLDARGTVLSRQEILDTVWGSHYFGGSNIVDVHIKTLRNKLKDNPKVPDYIATVRSIGYRLAD